MGREIRGEQIAARMRGPGRLAEDRHAPRVSADAFDVGRDPFHRRRDVLWAGGPCVGRREPVVQTETAALVLEQRAWECSDEVLEFAPRRIE